MVSNCRHCGTEFEPYPGKLYCNRLCKSRAKERRKRTRPVDARKNLGGVYLIQAQSGPIKIGVSCNPRDRLRKMQTGSHEWFRLLAVIPGGQDVEGCLHRAFADAQIRGEWFRPIPPLLALAACWSPTPK